MPNFLVQYYFDGSGSVNIEAKDEEEAKQKFYDGEDYTNVQESGENYCVDYIKQN